MTSLATLAQYRNAKILVASVNDGLYTDDQLQQFLDAATSYLESMCYQKLIEQEITETLRLGNTYCSVDENGMLNVLPKNTHLVSVTSLSYRYLPGQDYILFDPDTYVSDDDIITVPWQLFSSRSFGQIQLVYTAGYPADAVPEDLMFACVVVAAYFASLGYVAVTVRGQAVSTVLPPWAWSRVEDTINRYQRQF